MCDGILEKYCEMHSINRIGPNCKECFGYGKELADAWKLDVVPLSSLISLNLVDLKLNIKNKSRESLLVYLKDNAGLTYGMIKKVPIFSDLKINSLGWIYKNAKIRLKN